MLPRLSGQENFLLFLFIAFITLCLDIIAAQTHFFFTKKHLRKDHYPFGRYIFLLVIPFLGSILMVFEVGISIVEAFLLFAVVGTTLEYVSGKIYKEIMGKRLWTYYKYTIGTYTSFLAIPFWGFAGVFFYLFAQALAK